MLGQQVIQLTHDSRLPVGLDLNDLPNGSLFCHGIRWSQDREWKSCAVALNAAVQILFKVKMSAMEKLDATGGGDMNLQRLSIRCYNMNVSSAREDGVMLYEKAGTGLLGALANHIREEKTW